MNQLVKYCSWLLVLILVFGCTEENQQTSLSGTLVGEISCFDRNTNKLGDQSGVSISIEGGPETILLTTGVSGEFETLLQTGTYDITLTKDGFGTHKLVGFSFVGGEAPVAISNALYELPDVVVEKIEVKDISNDFQVFMEVKVFVDLPANSATSGIYRYYLGSSGISVSNYIETGIVSANVNGGTFTFTREVKPSVFPIGSDVFLMVAPCTEADQRYIDIETGNLIFSSVNSSVSKIVSFKMPD